jgi:hypothetical protein
VLLTGLVRGIVIHDIQLELDRCGMLTGGARGNRLCAINLHLVIGSKQFLFV